MCSLFLSLKKAQEVEILVDCKLHSGITRGIYSILVASTPLASTVDL